MVATPSGNSSTSCQHAVAVQEAQRKIAPAFIVAFFEKRWPVRRFVESPADTVAELDGIVCGCRVERLLLRHLD
jgi:hypothetical protein